MNVDYSGFWDGVQAGVGMLWAAVTSSPWTFLLFAVIVVGAVFMQLIPRRRRRRR